MPRKPRIHVYGAFYHVTLRGNHRQDIFFCDDDRLLLNGIVADVIEHLGARVHAYCWMTNHIHLLVQVGEVPLSRVMLRIASRYARSVQKRFQTTGHLFECRYHAVLVDADEYLLTLIRYIHLNPVEACMTGSVDDYPWSSHHNYVGARTDTWVTTSFAWSMWHAERDRAIHVYRQFMGESSNRSSRAYTDELNPNDTRILGCDTFVAAVQGLAWRPKSHKTLDQLIDEACTLHAVSREQLSKPGRSRAVARARAWVAQQASAHRIASLASVAALFGRDESTLRKSAQRYFDLR